MKQKWKQLQIEKQALQSEIIQNEERKQSAMEVLRTKNEGLSAIIEHSSINIDVIKSKQSQQSNDINASCSSVFWSMVS